MAKSKRNGSRAKVLGILTALLLEAAITLPAVAAEIHRFDIQTADAATAIHEFGNQSGVQILASAQALDGKHLNSLSGELSTEDGFRKLLAGTGLAHRYVGDRSVAIAPLSGQSSPSSARERTSAAGGEKKSFWQRLRLAQAATSSRSEEEKNSEGSSGSSQKRVELEEIVVTGTNIRGVYPSSSPVEIYTAEDIARTGATTTEQFIAKLPQNLGTRTQYASTATSSANRESVSGVDLRGLGAGTTLTLLNGRRMALANNGQTADISMIPLSVIERVEVLSDGASAIYGSDAIGGVVNFVLRDEFDGAESRLSYGSVTSGGLHQGEFAQTFGDVWASGHALASFDYFSASALEAADRDYARSSIWARTDLTPVIERYNGLATASQDIGDRLAIEGLFSFTRRDVEAGTLANFLTGVPTEYDSETEAYFADFGAEYRMTGSLNASVAATYSKSNADTVFEFSGLRHDTDYSALDLTAKLDGSLLDLPAGTLRFSIGGGYLEESYVGARAITGLVSGRDLGRATRYAFAEFLAPLINEEKSVALVHRLELSVAARYTSYDDTSRPSLGREFGDRVSPKVGLLWAPVPSLSLRLTYGESFRAPALAQVDPSTARSLLQNLTVGGVASTAISVQGPEPSLDAETAESHTAGFDFRPASRPTFGLSASYFSIDYSDRVAIPNTTPALQNPTAWPELIHRPASAAEIENILWTLPVGINTSGVDLSDPNVAAQALFARLPNIWIVDQTVRNLAVSRLDGYDLRIHDRLDTSWGQLSLGGQLTHLLSYEEQVSPSASTISVIDTVLRPASFKARAYVGLTRGALNSTVSINYVGGYENPLATTASGGPHGVDSWTTVDWSVFYDIGRTSRGLLSGMRLGVSVQNLLDEDPPFVAGGVGGNPNLNASPGFDPANADPLGRMISLEITKAW